MSGRIEVITGPMFSGKTQDLLTKMKRFHFSKKKYILFKPKVDNRYSEDSVVSHNKNSLSAVNIETSEDLIKYCFDRPEIKNIGIDEIQFLESKNSEEIIQDLIKLRNNGYHIIIAGLDMDFMGQPFKFMPQLLAIADHVYKQKAVCFDCGEDAGMTHRINNSKELVELGADGSYKALCLTCWIKFNPS